MTGIARSSLAALSGVLLVAGVLAGCGGSKGPSPASPSAPASQSAPASPSAPASQSAGSDTAYVSGFCAAVLHSGAEAAKGEPSPGREATAEDIKKLGPVFAELADGLEKLNPPANVLGYHEALVKAMHASADQLATYRRGAGDPFAPVEGWYLPAKTGQRLQAIAAKNPDCTKAGFRFDNTHPFSAD